MASVLTIRTEITVTDADVDTDSTPPTFVVEKTVSSIDEDAVRKGSVATATIRTVWDPAAAGEHVTSFRGLVFWTDGTLELELTTANGDADEALYVVTVAAGVPFMLGADESRNNYTTNAFAGDVDVIDLLRINNTSGATVKYWLALYE